MKRFILPLALILLILSSCQDKEKKQPNTLENSVEKTEEKHPKRLKFEIDLEATNSEEFSLYSKEIFVKNEQFMDINIKQKFSGKDVFKNLIFEFPLNVVPDYNLGLVFGNKKEKEVTIKKITLSFANNTLEVKPEDLDKYFNFNKFIENKGNGNLVIKKVDGKLNPVMSLRKKHLSKLTQN